LPPKGNVRRLRAIVNDAIKPYPSSTSVGSGLTGRYAVLIGIDDPLTPAGGRAAMRGAARASAVPVMDRR